MWNKAISGKEATKKAVIADDFNGWIHNTYEAKYHKDLFFITLLLYQITLKKATDMVTFLCECFTFIIIVFWITKIMVVVS